MKLEAKNKREEEVEEVEEGAKNSSDSAGLDQNSRMRSAQEDVGCNCRAVVGKTAAFKSVLEQHGLAAQRTIALTSANGTV